MSANLRDCGVRPCSSAAVDEPRSIDDLATAIRLGERGLNVETYRILMLVREFDDRCGWQKWGYRNCAEWLAWSCDLGMSAARERVRTAQALREMPAIAAAFEDGRLSYSKVRALTRVVEYRDEEQLLDYALRVSAEQVEDRCREIRNGAPESTAGAWRAWEHRSLIISRDAARGMMKITVEVPIEDGEVIANAIERVADAGDAAIGPEFAAARKAAGVREVDGSTANGWRAQQADALLAIMKASLSGNAGTSARAGSAADHYQVVVHVDDSALRGGIGRSDLPIETVKRLTCDGSVITIVEDEHGTPLDVGRKQRTVSTALRRALWSRDRGCRFPECRNKRYIDAHHARHWAAGGETSLANVVLFCTHHHRLFHEGGFSIRRDANGELEFVRPDGRVIPRCGYRLDDMVDDFVTDAPNPSAEGCGATHEREPSVEGCGCTATRDPSAEVRETAAIYRIAPRYGGRLPALR
ncbi:MAG TPA: DUF222 domain-containing protein [Gammaproteobacteria bacterium]|nr:DUF222 domain-containing protein [Gammaproteobacteria bacterium]